MLYQNIPSRILCTQYCPIKTTVKMAQKLCAGAIPIIVVKSVAFNSTNGYKSTVLLFLFTTGIPAHHHFNLWGIYLPRFDSAVLDDVVTSVCNEDRYHYGFNGKMKDNKWAGVGRILHRVCLSGP